jgi:Ser/Thr protein kinase RdoA (MazF antagonist)
MTSGEAPVEHSIIAAEALAESVWQRYSLDGLVQCQLLNAGLNDTYVVVAPAARWVARVYNARGRPRDDIEYEVELVLHLAAKGVTVAAPIPDRDGRIVHSLRAPEGLRSLVLFAHAPGHPMTWRSRRHCRLAGRLAARIHAAAEGFGTKHARSPLDLHHLIDEPLEAVLRFLKGRRNERRDLVHLATRLRERAFAATAEGLDWGVCHGDFGASNIHVADEAEAWAFDFDLCGPGWRAWDLVAGRAMSLYENDEEIWRSFSRGYEEIRPLGAADLAALPVFLAIARLWSLGVRAANARLRGTWPMEEGHLDGCLSSLRRWEAEAPR